MEEAFNAVCRTMSRVSRPQMKFLWILLSTLMVFQGKATFRNLSRYSDLHEKTYSRWYRREFDFVMLNCELMKRAFSKQYSEQIAVIDASFMRKSGQRTEGLGFFLMALPVVRKKD